MELRTASSIRQFYRPNYGFGVNMNDVHWRQRNMLVAFDAKRGQTTYGKQLGSITVGTFWRFATRGVGDVVLVNRRHHLPAGTPSWEEANYIDGRSQYGSF